MPRKLEPAFLREMREHGFVPLNDVCEQLGVTRNGRAHRVLREKHGLVALESTEGRVTRRVYRPGAIKEALARAEAAKALRVAKNAPERPAPEGPNGVEPKVTQPELGLDQLTRIERKLDELLGRARHRAAWAGDPGRNVWPQRKAGL